MRVRYRRRSGAIISGEELPNPLERMRIQVKVVELEVEGRLEQGALQNA
jgi:hypothetical protein